MEIKKDCTVSIVEDDNETIRVELVAK